MGGPLYLRPRLEPTLASLLADTTFLHRLVAGLGSPLNVLIPDQLPANVDAFRSVYRTHRLRGHIAFAHKANQSSALVRRLSVTESSVDVASLEELQHALASGFGPDRIGATGPKEPDFLWLGARTGVTFQVDSAAELTELTALIRGFGLPRVRVMLRLSGFSSSGVRTLPRRSRFGTPVAEVAGLLDLVERCQDAVELIGVGYHLDTVSLAEKAVALEGCLRVMDDCRARGMRPRVVDIGGGFGVSYLDDAEQWETYTTELTRSVLGTRPPLAWRGHGYGLRNDSGRLAGGLALYPAHRETAGAGYLDALLRTPGPSLGRPLGELLLEGLYDLYTEPGRALLDNCGITLARVLEVRGAEGSDGADGVRGTDGADGSAEARWHIRLGMNASDCALEDHGILMDPLVLPREGAPPAPEEPVAVHLFGNLCLESDLITRRTVFLPRLPAPGDLLCFVNTAGYCMDFQAHQAQRRPPARKVAVRQEAGTWHWLLDDQYWPTTIPGERT